MAYMFANEVNDVLNKNNQPQDVVGALVERFYQEIVTLNNQKLLDLAFNENLQQSDLDAFMENWDIEENTGNKAIMVAYLMKERPDLKFPESVKPRLAGLLNYYRFQNLQLIAHFTKICRDMMKSKAWIELNLRQKRIISTLKI